MSLDTGSAQQPELLSLDAPLPGVSRDAAPDSRFPPVVIPGPDGKRITLHAEGVENGIRSLLSIAKTNRLHLRMNEITCLEANDLRVPFSMIDGCLVVVAFGVDGKAGMGHFATGSDLSGPRERRCLSDMTAHVGKDARFVIVGVPLREGSARARHAEFIRETLQDLECANPEPELMYTGEYSNVVALDNSTRTVHVFFSAPELRGCSV